MKHLLLALFLPTLGFAQQPSSPVEARLRDALKKLTTRVTNAESALANAQVAQAAAETQNKELSAKLEASVKEMGELKVAKAADRAAAEKNRAEQAAKIAAQQQEIARLTESLAKWKEGYGKLTDLSRATEAKRAELDTKVIALQRKVDDRENKNRELFKLGNEILDRYRNFGLGTALTAREPFTGITRVKLQTLVQDYADKLADQKVKPEKK